MLGETAVKETTRTKEEGRDGDRAGPRSGTPLGSRTRIRDQNQEGGTRNREHRAGPKEVPGTRVTGFKHGDGNQGARNRFQEPDLN